MPQAAAFMMPQGSPPPHSAGANNQNIYRLEQEMNEIKTMLNEFGNRNKQHNAERISDMIQKIDVEDSNQFGPAGMSMVNDSMALDDDVQTMDWVKRQKGEVKQL